MLHRMRELCVFLHQRALCVPPNSSVRSVLALDHGLRTALYQSSQPQSWTRQADALLCVSVATHITSQAAL